MKTLKEVQVLIKKQYLKSLPGSVSVRATLRKTAWEEIQRSSREAEIKKLRKVVATGKPRLIHRVSVKRSATGELQVLHENANIIPAKARRILKSKFNIEV